MYRSSTFGRRGGRMLIVVALFELVLAAGFWLILGGVQEAGPAMVLTAAILGGVGVVLLLAGLLWMRSAARKDRISATGVAGTGQIMGLRQTGMTINDQPQVELDLLVTIPGRSPYRARVKEIVPLIMLNRLQGSLPVRVNPSEPDTVVVQWDQPNVGHELPEGFDLAEIDRSGTVVYAAGGEPGAGGFAGGGLSSPGAGSGSGTGVDETLGQVAAAMAAAGGSGAAPVYGQAGQAGLSIEQLRAWLRANGLAGTARIDRLIDSGQTVGNDRLFTMTTTVSIPGRAPFATEPSAAMVPLEKVGRISVGVSLPVRVAPDNPDLLMFEWDRV
jgi:hypothetical protein